MIAATDQGYSIPLALTVASGSALATLSQPSPREHKQSSQMDRVSDGWRKPNQPLEAAAFQFFRWCTGPALSTKVLKIADQTESK